MYTLKSNTEFFVSDCTEVLKVSDDTSESYSFSVHVCSNQLQSKHDYASLTVGEMDSACIQATKRTLI